MKEPPWNGMLSSMAISPLGSTDWSPSCGMRWSPTPTCSGSVGRSSYVDTLVDSKFANMKELRVQFRGDPWRILFAFDPRRVAILLVGGNKQGDTRWYKKHLPIADERFRRHLEGLA